MYPVNLRLLTFLALVGTIASVQAATLKDAYPDKARYAPGEPIHLRVELEGTVTAGDQLSARITDLGNAVGSCRPVTVTELEASPLISCSVPAGDFRGYLVSVELRSHDGQILGHRETAIDISSDWKRFPRYGYLAHWNAREGAAPAQWVAELNKFHIDGLEFYDFQYRHDQPLAGTVEQPAATWKDIAGREVDAGIVRGFIEQAHTHNMMAMAYNASYSAYDDVFTGAKPFPLQWATWPTANGPRTPQSVKIFVLRGGWSTSKLFYMNQNDPGWQNYLFGQMEKLFQAYPFDGWHIDTFGEKSGYAFDGSPVNYIAGFKPYIDRASEALKRPILFNAVNTWGQEKIATSSADFVYSELWEDHETFASILESAEQVHLANPAKGYVIAAYLHRYDGKDNPAPDGREFNLPSVLLTDATIFASGAAHIELGDGNRMLSSEYFPADTRFAISPKLHEELRHYYDFLTAYEVYLRDQPKPARVGVTIAGHQVDALGVPNTIWSISREHGSMTMVHLINLLGSDDEHWRDISVSRPEAPSLHGLRVTLTVPKRVVSIGWASPDTDSSHFHPLTFHRESSEGEGDPIHLMLPELHYWDTLFIKTAD